MKIVTVESAQADLERLMETSTALCEPVLIASARGNVVLVPEAEWRAVQETLCLAAIHGMSESIRHGMREPLRDAADKLDW